MKVTFSSDDDANVGKGFRCYAECGIENCRKERVLDDGRKLHILTIHFLPQAVE